jgi:hypothetical protein
LLKTIKTNDMKNFTLKIGIVLMLLTSLMSCANPRDEKAEDAKIQSAVNNAVKIAVDSAVRVTIQAEVKKDVKQQISLQTVRKIARQESRRTAIDRQHADDELTQHMAGY